MKNKMFKSRISQETHFFRRKTDDFSQFKTKIFFRTVGMVMIAILSVYSLYNFVLYGHFAEGMIGIFQKIFRLDYGAAYALYQSTFRNNMDLVFLIGIVFVFFVVFRLYLNWFEKYFREINRGIDTLIDESAGEVSLPPELSVTEKKINTIKHTLVKKELDARLSEQRKNDLIIYLAHDLKTPLASVIGYLNLLRDERQISDELREKYLSISLEKAERLEDLVNEFFEIAKYNLSNVTLQYSRINLTRLLEMLLYEFQPMLKERNLSCSLDIAADTMLRCDANKIQRVLDNLLRNAVLYSYSGTEIEIAAKQRDGCLAIRFTNRGDTIPEEKIELIFEQFYRLDASRGTGSGGAGLGLAIAKQIVELHRGTITAVSRDELTTFEVTLPLS